MNVSPAEWLTEWAASERSAFRHIRISLPRLIYVSYGFPFQAALAHINPRFVECLCDRTGPLPRWQVFLSPRLSESVRVCVWLDHGLLHCRFGKGHGWALRRAQGLLGLDGTPAHPEPGPGIICRAHEHIDKMGSFPYFELPSLEANLRSHNRRYAMWCSDCGWRAEALAADIAAGLPTCHCGTLVQSAFHPLAEPPDGSACGQPRAFVASRSVATGSRRRGRAACGVFDDETGAGSMVGTEIPDT